MILSSSFLPISANWINIFFLPSVIVVAFNRVCAAMMQSSLFFFSLGFHQFICDDTHLFLDTQFSGIYLDDGLKVWAGTAARHSFASMMIS
jgi:hypothetical protein